MTASSSSPDADSVEVDRVVSAVIGEMSARIVEESQHIRQVLEREITELGGDGQMLQLLGASIESNVETVFGVLQHGISPDKLHVPAAAMEYAHRLARHAIPVTALVRAYRLGQSTFLDRIFDRIALSPIEPGLGLLVSHRIMSVSSTYIDWISEQVVTEYQSERERWLSNRNNIRAARIRELLASTTGTDDVTASAAIGYALAQRHCAVIAWLPDGDADTDALPHLERSIRDLAAILGTHGDPLFVAADRVSAWAWIPLGTRVESLELVAVHDFLATDAADGIRVAMGSAQPGSTGFRISHIQAQHARTMSMLTGRPDLRLISYTDPGLAAASLISADLPRARAWVSEVLGPLAADTASARRLRDTLRTFLAHRSSHKATAADLHLHYNTVKYRVKAAEHERGRPLSADRLDVEIALLVHHWLGGE